MAFNLEVKMGRVSANSFSRCVSSHVPEKPRLCEKYFLFP